VTDNGGKGSTPGHSTTTTGKAGSGTSKNTTQTTNGSSKITIAGDDDDDEEHEQNTDPLPVRLYFVHGAGLAAVQRGVAAANASDALAALLTGPTAADKLLGDSTAIPAGTTLHGVHLSGNTAIVDLSAAFTSGATSQSQMRTRVAEVVFTATEFAGVSDAAFAIDGKRMHTLGSAAFPVDPPPTRMDLTGALDTVLTEVPAPGTTITSPTFVLGMSNTFEGTVGLRLYDGNGHFLASATADATSGSGVWGTFTGKLTFPTPSTATGTLKVFDPSEGDNAGAHGQSIPVYFR
jgi:spore germination protein GerM